MHLWATNKLAEEIAADMVAPRDKVAYFIMGPVLYSVFVYISAYQGAHASWLFAYEAVVVLVITFAGAGKVAASYQRPIDAEFFLAVSLLSIPLTVKTTLAMWLAVYGAQWALEVLLPHISTTTEEGSRAMSYWLGRAWQLIPFLAATVVAFVYWSRLAHHVRYVASKRSP